MVSFLKAKLISLPLNVLGKKTRFLHKIGNAPQEREMCPRIFVVYPYSIVTYLPTCCIFCFLVVLFLPSCVQLVQADVIYLIDIPELTHTKLETWPPQSQLRLYFPDPFEIMLSSWLMTCFFPSDSQASDFQVLLHSCLSVSHCLDPLVRTMLINIKCLIVWGVSQMCWSLDTFMDISVECLCDATSTFIITLCFIMKAFIVKWYKIKWFIFLTNKWYFNCFF